MRLGFAGGFLQRGAKWAQATVHPSPIGNIYPFDRWLLQFRATVLKHKNFEDQMLKLIIETYPPTKSKLCS